MDSLIHELVAHELCRRFGLSPEFEPTVKSGRTPDMLVTVGGQSYILDVFVRHTPQATQTRDANGCIWTADGGEAAREIAEIVAAKASRYRDAAQPLLLVGFTGDQHLKPGDFERALFGASSGDGNLEQNFPWRIQKLHSSGGVLLPFRGEERPRHQNLSALIACNWFDSANREQPGKRFHCLVLHHWSPTVALRVGTFDPFPELVWEARPAGAFLPHVGGNPQTVARFGPGTAMEFGEYWGDAPW